MKIVMSSGHGKKCPGASGPSPWGLKEHDEAVRVVNKTAEFMRAAGADVTTYEDTVSTTQDENLKRITDFHNAQGPHDYDVFVHFNCNVSTSKPVGVECWWMTQEDLATDISTSIARASGLIDRGEKFSNGLYVLKHSIAPAVLPEICFVDSQADVNIYNSKFDAICQGLAEAITGAEIEPPGPTPVPPPDTDTRPMLQKGDTGEYVSELQRKLGVLIADGDFGSITETWVRAFQAACGIGVDGKVGNQTWAQVDALQERVDAGDPPLPAALASQIYTMAQTSEIADYSWPDRGVPPQGYIAGMALSFAYAVTRWQNDDEAAGQMAHSAGSPDTDALAWYASEFSKLGMSNNVSGLDTLRHLFVMQIGLGPRESSGIYFEGRDMSASNIASDTCEAGLFQTSWNIRSSSSAISPLLKEFWDNPNGFLSEFKQGLSPTANNLNSYGSGDGVKYQFLSRFCPLFHVMVTAVGMRKLRQHWGPINRREVTLKKEADQLLRDVQDLVTAVA